MHSNANGALGLGFSSILEVSQRFATSGGQSAGSAAGMRPFRLWWPAHPTEIGGMDRTRAVWFISGLALVGAAAAIVLASNDDIPFALTAPLLLVLIYAAIICNRAEKRIKGEKPRPPVLDLTDKDRRRAGHLLIGGTVIFCGVLLLLGATLRSWAPTLGVAALGIGLWFLLGFAAMRWLNKTYDKRSGR
jgi:hypothetical protein